ncbi:class III extradiol ring-cleavage dioxygenase [Limibacillus sp. MBR-115]|uniref:DODA-type extradiol aromatic ring-opening family dioxygenase n=1 Tax=Limibacillus sp. MBR-115 TaxID=3156465 RepID=UPI003395C28E
MPLKPTPMPALFVSHGSPMLAVEKDAPGHRFLEGLAASLPRPEGILVISAHWETDKAAVSLATAPDTIHDFYGFPRQLYELTYPAAGSPSLAQRTADLLKAGGLPTTLDESRGLDHGAWVPLLLAYPEADIPVTQLSVQTHKGPAHHRALGRLLAPLRDEGILILGSGSLTHDLGSFRGQAPDAPVPAWVSDFADWMAERVTSGDNDAIEDYREKAPHAARNHPTEEHLLPLHVALGAGEGPTGKTHGEVLHRSYDRAILALDAYAFG